MKRENKSGFRVVPDTNVILSSELSRNKQRPNKDFTHRWFQEEFDVLYSDDTQIEYAAKLLEKQIPREKIIRFLSGLISLGNIVTIKNYHLKYYPEDEDDICFVLCADNGSATHLVSYDVHLLTLNGKYEFEILKVVPFLKRLRETAVY